jgi:hypothetical protein
MDLVGRFHGSNHMLAKSDVRDAAAGCTSAATLGWRPYDQLHGIGRLESWPRKTAQDDKWSFCLTAGTLWPANQERP